MEPPKNQDESLKLFKQGADILENALAGLRDIELDYSPSNGGWSIRQIIHHIVDGDDLWKTCIKMAMGNEQPEFTLGWYWSKPQTEWTKIWKYDKRPIGESIKLLRANRDHVLQLLEYADDVWNKSVRFLKPKIFIRNEYFAVGRW